MGRILILSQNHLTGEFLKACLNKIGPFEVIHQHFQRMAIPPPGFYPGLVLFVGMENFRHEVKSAMTLHPFARYLLVGRLAPAEAVDWIRTGVHGLLDESDFETDLHILENAIRAVIAGEIWASRRILSQVCSMLTQKLVVPETRLLSRREEELMNLIYLGLDNSSIGMRLRISEKTVKRHLTTIYRKLRVKNRIQAALKYQEAAFLQGTGTCAQPKS